MSKTQPMLLLFPNLLGKHRHHEPYLPSSVDTAVQTIDGLIAESSSGGRSFLKRFQTKKPPHEIPIALLKGKCSEEDLDFLLEPLQAGERWGFVSDAGLPCIADPGGKLVFRARQKGIAVQAFVGPSSITCALMLSGLPGQQFAFHGYIPKGEDERKRAIARWEKRSREDMATQIFIETPYRNRHVLESLLKTLHAETLLCCAWDLSMATQSIVSQKVRTWKKTPLPKIDKKPAIFLFYAGSFLECGGLAPLC